MIQSILSPPPQNLKNHLILASPVLEDSIFDRSCILITEQNETGHEGYILNHKTNQTLSDLISKMKGSSLSDTPVYIGGPVKPDSIHFLAIESTADKQFSIHTNIKIEHAEALAEEKKSVIFPCLGYSGWTPGQLKNEFDQYTWYFRLPPFNFPSRNFNKGLWKDLLEEISPYHKLIANAPSSPLQN